MPFELIDLFINLEKNRTSQDLTKLVQFTYGYGAKVSSEFPHEVVGARNFTSEVSFINRPEISRFFSGFTLDKAYIESFILGEEHEVEKHTNIQNLSVCELLTIVTKMSQHESYIKIANDINVNVDLLTTVKDISQVISKSYPKNSQKKLSLLPVDRLSTYQYKIVSSLAKRFDNVVVKPNLSRSLQCMETLAGSKDFLIRSADHQAIAQLLVLLEKLKFTDRHLAFSWFLPVKQEKAGEVYKELNLALAAIRRWEKLIHSTLGFKNALIRVVLPKQCGYSDHVFAPFGQVVRSNEGIFLGASDFGVMAMNVKRLKTENQRFDTQLSIRNPRRSYALIAFLHLLLIYNELNS